MSRIGDDSDLPVWTRKEKAVINPWVSIEFTVTPFDNFVDCTSGLDWPSLCFPGPLPGKGNDLSSLNFSFTENPLAVSLLTLLLLLEVAEEIWGFSLGSGNEWYVSLLAPLLFFTIFWVSALLEQRNMLIVVQLPLCQRLHWGNNVCRQPFVYNDAIAGLCNSVSICNAACLLWPTVYRLLNASVRPTT